MVIVFNPAAGRRRAALLWRVLDVMAGSGVKLEISETRHPGHATDIARNAARRGARLVVAAGGDGTIGEVATGLAGSKCRLGIIPLGTANVLAHELDLPRAPRAVAAALAFGRTRPVWPGVVERAGEQRLFVQMLGAGFDAQVVHRISAPVKRVLGRSAYFFQGLRELCRYRFPPIHLLIDNQEARAASVIVSKGRLYGGAYTVAPGASPLAPGFTVVLFERGGAWQGLLNGAALPLDLIPRMPGVRLMRANRVEIGSAVPVQVDGDPCRFAPLAITDAPAPIDVVMA
jgi:YegS/Rv2252/BmrU family lipid kinase